MHLIAILAVFRFFWMKFLASFFAFSIAFGQSHGGPISPAESLKQFTVFDDLEIDQLLAEMTEYFDKREEPSLEAYLEEKSLMTSADEKGENGHAITLMTLHSAKGLEFPLVFARASSAKRERAARTPRLTSPAAILSRARQVLHAARGACRNMDI